jgi:predicted DNA-binding ribbon-helix-helix protein
MKIKVSVTLDPDIMKKLKAVSEQRKVSISFLINLILEGLVCLDDFAN